MTYRDMQYVMPLLLDNFKCVLLISYYCRDYIFAVIKHNCITEYTTRTFGIAL